MLNNNIQNRECTFAEQLVAYLYDEIGVAEKPAFEAHLLDCENCADEFREFSNINFSLSEWRKADFETLSFPVFVMPQTFKAKSEKVSPLAAIRAYLTFSPIFTAATLTALLICAGLLLFATSFSSEKDVAERKNEAVQNKQEKIPYKNPINEKQTVVTDENVVAVEKIAANPANNVVKSAPSPNIRLKNEAAKIGKSDRISVHEMASNKTGKSGAPDTGKDAPVKTPVKNEVPSLTIEDDEDNSLRLSDVLDEVGMVNASEVKDE